MLEKTIVLYKAWHDCYVTKCGTPFLCSEFVSEEWGISSPMISVHACTEYMPRHRRLDIIPYYNEIKIIGRRAFSGTERAVKRWIGKRHKKFYYRITAVEPTKRKRTHETDPISS